ncbi:hypothetical protein [Bacillus sp. FJAT-27245]|uniref:hypothetical protein n=1 Tax=Bacillus sp. FJAT-27245 TaxID=1684144 RepID=UPI0006A7D177|nr:hypothetical protein [Bacillus sp. FJAT-27245]
MEKKKKKRGLRWLFFGLLLGALIFTAFHLANWNGMLNPHFFPTQNQVQGIVQDTFRKGKEVTGNFNGHAFHDRDGMGHAAMGHGSKFGGQGVMMGRHHGYHPHHGFGFGGFFVVLGGLALALIGLYVRRKNENKWLGNALIVLGVLPFLSRLPFLLIIIAGILAYWFIKKGRNDKAVEAAVPSTFQHDYSMNGQFLDEWERTNKREDK